MTASSGILISEEEFARVVALKAERDALELEAQTTRAELERARMDLVEFKTRQKELQESSKSLGHELELAQQTVSEADKRLSHVLSEKRMLEKRLAALEEQIVALKDQIVLRDSQIAKRDAQLQSLKSELDTARLDIMQYQVERSKAQISAQSANELQEIIVRLENELKLKEEHELLNEKRLVEMQNALSELESMVAQATQQNAKQSDLQATPVNLITYDSRPFLESCSMSELLARVALVTKQKDSELRSAYVRGFIFFTIVLVILVITPIDDADMSDFMRNPFISWIRTRLNYADSI